MRFLACDQAGTVLMKKEYYSIGGGFVMNCDGVRVNAAGDAVVPYPYGSGDELVRMADEAALPNAGLVMENEKSWPRSEERRVVKECVSTVRPGCSANH